MAGTALAQTAGELPPAGLVVPQSAPDEAQDTAGHELVAVEGRYRVTGNRSVRPSIISDDGVRTYIEWDQSQAIPAVFAAGTGRREEIVNGYMRGDQYVVDRVYAKLIFRIDEVTATARRVRKKGR